MKAAARLLKPPRSVLMGAAIFMAAAGGLLLFNWATVAMAKQQDIVRCNPQDGRVKIYANETPISELIHSLSTKSCIKLVGHLSGIDHKISGTFEGPLPEVLRQLLRHVSYTLITEAGRGERLMILGSNHISRPPLAASTALIRTRTASDSQSQPMIDLLRKKESQLIALSSRYTEKSARAQASPEFVKRMAEYAESLLRQARAIRAKIDASR